MVIGFEFETYTVLEETESGPSSVAEVCVQLIGQLERSVTVTLYTEEDSATGIGSNLN